MRPKVLIYKTDTLCRIDHLSETKTKGSNFTTKQTYGPNFKDTCDNKTKPMYVDIH